MWLTTVGNAEHLQIKLILSSEREKIMIMALVNDLVVILVKEVLDGDFCSLKFNGHLESVIFFWMS